MTEQFDTVQNIVEDTTQTVLSKTYEQVAFDFMSKLVAEASEHTTHLLEADGDLKKVRADIQEGIVRFAHYLDGFNTISKDLQIIAMSKAREIDQEFLGMLIDAIGKPKAIELARELHSRHAHTYVAETKEDEGTEEVKDNATA